MKRLALLTMGLLFANNKPMVSKANLFIRDSLYI